VKIVSVDPLSISVGRSGQDNRCGNVVLASGFHLRSDGRSVEGTARQRVERIAVGGGGLFERVCYMCQA
jgi:hypothetical protein